MSAYRAEDGYSEQHLYSLRTRMDRWPPIRSVEVASITGIAKAFIALTHFDQPIRLRDHSPGDDDRKIAIFASGSFHHWA